MSLRVSACDFPQKEHIVKFDGRAINMGLVRDGNIPAKVDQLAGNVETELLLKLSFACVWKSIGAARFYHPGSL